MWDYFVAYIPYYNEYFLRLLHIQYVTENKIPKKSLIIGICIKSLQHFNSTTLKTIQLAMSCKLQNDKTEQVPTEW